VADKYTARQETIMKIAQTFQNTIAPAMDGLRQQVETLSTGQLGPGNWDDVAHDKFVQVANHHKDTLGKAREFLEYVGGELIWQASDIVDTSANTAKIVH
jgi:hypothetical protein